MRKYRKTASAVALASLSACSNDSDVKIDDGHLSARLVMPAPLLSARAPDNPSPEVLLNGNSVPASQNDDSQQWTAGIEVLANRQYQLEVRWQDDSSLIFAEASDCFSTAADAPVALTFSSDDYDTSLDNDGDGRSNLDELNADTNPRDVNSPPERLAQSALSLSVGFPEFLRAIPDATLDSFQVRVVVNGLPVTNLVANDDNDGYRGQANVSLSSRAFVIVDWNYRLPDGSTVRVARLAQPQQINDSGETAFQPDQGAYRTDFDRDSDGRSNLDEVVSGSDAVSGVTSVCTR